jgi:MFS family permease
LFLVPDGPYRKRSQGFNLTAFANGFKQPNFRSAAFGYFGHMWELYTFWAFVPVMLVTYKNYYPESQINVPLLSFLIIASGGLACAMSGSLSLSFLCCLASPLLLLSSSVTILVVFLFFWGLVVIADSPLFSTLVAQNAPEESRGTSLTIVNCIGFSITIVSIQLLNLASTFISPQYLYMLLAVGPLLGLVALLRKDKSHPVTWH